MAIVIQTFSKDDAKPVIPTRPSDKAPSEALNLLLLWKTKYYQTNKNLFGSYNTKYHFLLCWQIYSPSIHHNSSCFSLELLRLFCFLQLSAEAGWIENSLLAKLILHFCLWKTDSPWQLLYQFSSKTFVISKKSNLTIYL